MTPRRCTIHSYNDVHKYLYEKSFLCQNSINPFGFGCIVCPAKFDKNKLR